jgi:hypothetical protein
MMSGRMPCGIAEGEHAVARDHRDHRVCALHAAMHAATAVKMMSGSGDRARARIRDLVGEHVQQDLRIEFVLTWRRSAMKSSRRSSRS